MRKSIFDKGHRNKSSQTLFGGLVEENDIDDLDSSYRRHEPLGLPTLSEVEVIRHYTNLSKDNYGVDNGSYPLGSCTMKYNPKCNDRYSDFDGFRYSHPSQPVETLRGLWELFYSLQELIAEITGMDAVSLQPAAGAHGELAGLMIIKKHLEQSNKKKNIILIADSAHGTNPASAAMAGFECRIIDTDKDGLMDLDVLARELNSNVAALMLTNPSTLGLFEQRIETISRLVHDNDSLLYYDGANMNALMGIVRPGDMGFDIVHVNTHKTFATPHGGGGPGAGPIGVKRFLSKYLPYPVAIKTGNQYGPSQMTSESIGKIKNYYGHVDVLVRCYGYIKTMGADGLKEASENAVLNANYIQACLGDVLPPVYDKHCMHECLLSGNKLKISAYNFAKRLIDYEVHPPTLLGAGCVYFSQDLRSAMLIEPTETETKESLDELVRIFKKVIEEVEQDTAYIEQSPHTKSVSQIPLNSNPVE